MAGAVARRGAAAGAGQRRDGTGRRGQGAMTEGRGRGGEMRELLRGDVGGRGGRGTGVGGY